MPRTQTKPEQNTAQRLSSIVKSVRDIMRKDKGLNGDADRLPMLTWMMFLKFLDDLELEHETQAQLERRTYKPLIESPYRWRDWASANMKNLERGVVPPSGDDLIAFINNDETNRPDNTRGAGLFAYLRKLEGETQNDRRNVVATVFKGTINRMTNGYLMREVLEKLDSLSFATNEETHMLGQLYEGLLKEMRDSAGDAGEFYTPRAVVKLMVKTLNPKLGETVLDPACGTAGFLVEAYEHLRAQATTTQDLETLQNNSIVGGEAKPLPYLLAQMNLTLHGLENPRIDPGNSLRFNLSEIGDKDRVDVILIAPPFNGEEGRDIQQNFPPDKRASETDVLFLQLAMRRLKRKTSIHSGGRASVIVSQGLLFREGAAARVKKELLEDFNLHTIVRLPSGIFAPWKMIPTNLLFFTKGQPTTDIWYFEHQLPEGKKNYTKTQPVQFEEFTSLLEWWDNRTESQNAWKVAASAIAANGYNLDIKNPNSSEDFEHMPPEQLLADILVKETRILEILHELKSALKIEARA